MVLSHQLRFRLQPVLGIAAIFTAASLVQFVGTAANPLLKIDSGCFAGRVIGFCLGFFRDDFHSISRPISVEVYKFPFLYSAAIVVVMTPLSLPRIPPRRVALADKRNRFVAVRRAARDRHVLGISQRRVEREH
jgi:hypothetical protein